MLDIYAKNILYLTKVNVKYVCIKGSLKQRMLALFRNYKVQIIESELLPSNVIMSRLCTFLQ